MRKVIILIAIEILFASLIVIGLNLLVFRAFTLSLSPVLFVLKLGISTGFRAVSIRIVFYVMAALAIAVIQFIFMYQAIRKEILSLRNRNTQSQGSARWSDREELQAKRLIDKIPHGIILGQTADAKAITDESEAGFRITKPGSRLISDDSSYHAIVIGATGSGKGVGIIMPTLFTWKESVIVVDPKGESYDICGGFRSEFSETYYFNPVDKSGRSCCINPLDFIPVNADAIPEVSNLAMMLHPNRSEKDPYWDDVPRMMEEMLIGHILIKGKSKSLPEAADIINLAQDSWTAVFKGILDSYKTEPLKEDDPLYPLSLRVTSYAKQFYDLASGEQSDQMSTHITTVKKDLSLYSSPDTARIMKHSDFSIQDIVDGVRPLSLFLCVPVKDLERVMPMFKLIYTLILKSLLGMQQKHSHKLLLLLDEFSQFRKFELIAEQIPFVRSFGIRIMAFIQSVSQLNEYYGNEGAKALLDNFQLKIFLKATAPETCDYFSKMLGKRTDLRKSTSFSSNRRNIGVQNWTESTSEIGRELLTSEEIMNLPGYDSLIFRPNIHPYRAKKIQYFSDPRFKTLMNMEIMKPALPPFTSDTDEIIHEYAETATIAELWALHIEAEEESDEPEDTDADIMSLNLIDYTDENSIAAEETGSGSAAAKDISHKEEESYDSEYI